MEKDVEQAEAGLESRPTPAVLATLVGNRAAFLGFLERRVGSRSEAEDLLQEAFARGLDKLDTLRDGEQVTAWFYRLLRNAVIDRARRHSSSAKALANFASELSTVELAPEGELRATICACIGPLADTLKPEYRDALRRIEVDGVAVKDYAVEAGISSSNAAVRVFRARDALRKQVARCCGSCAEHGCVDCTCRA